MADVVPPEPNGLDRGPLRNAPAFPIEGARRRKSPPGTTDGTPQRLDGRRGWMLNAFLLGHPTSANWDEEFSSGGFWRLDDELVRAQPVWCLEAMLFQAAADLQH